MFCDYLNMWQQFDGVHDDFFGGRVVSVEGAGKLVRMVAVDDDGQCGELWGLSGDDCEIEYDVAKFAQHRGSFETSLRIRFVGGKLEVSGNPSAYGRLDNLFGLGLDAAVEVYNSVLRSLGLPEFTAGDSRLVHGGYSTSTEAWAKTYTGAHITRFDGTQNYAVGMGKTAMFHRWLAQQKIYRSAPGEVEIDQFAKWNWQTVYVSTSKFYINAKFYDKGDALTEVSLPQYFKKLKAAAKDGRISEREVRQLYSEAETYLNDLACWCAELGVTRGEWSLRSRYFTQHSGLGFWTPGATEAAISEVIGAEMEKVSARAVVYQVESFDSLSASEYKALDLWKKGENVRETMKSTTFYRLRAAVREKTGYDIAARPNVTSLRDARPVFFQVRALTLKDSPVWYQRPSAQALLAA